MKYKKQVISHKLFRLLLGSSRKKKRVLSLTFLGISFLLSSTMTSAPGSNAFDIQNRFGPPPENVELVGRWAYGACEASAVDATRNVALIGNGYTLQVLDISTPSSLSKIGEIELDGSVQDIAISGNYAYVVTHCYLIIVDISDLNSPSEVGSSDYFEEAGFQSLALYSGYAYVAASWNGLIIYNVSNPENPTQHGQYQGDRAGLDLHVSDVVIWDNYAICECEYWGAPDILVSTYGVEVIGDLLNPNPSLIGFYPPEDQPEAVYKLKGIDVSSDGQVYACQYSDTEEKSKLTVIDVDEDPSNPKPVGDGYEASDSDFEGVTLSGNYAYVYDDWRGGHLITIDISDSSDKLYYVGECNADRGFQNLSISGSYVGISHENRFSLYDVSDPGSPSQLGSYRTPDNLGRIGHPVVVSGDYAYIAYHGDGLRIMDVSDPSNPFVAGVCEGINGGSVAISGRFAYCPSSNFGGRLYVADISSPTNPYGVTHLSFPSDNEATYEPRDVAVRDSYAYVSGNKWTAGSPWGFLAVVDVSNPLGPEIVGLYDCPAPSFNVGGISVSGNYAYLAVEDYSGDVDLRANLWIIDISDPSDPTEVGSYFSGEEDITYAVTDSEGQYSHEVGYGWSGTATPSHPDYDFSPSTRTYRGVTSDQVEQDYTATEKYTSTLPHLTRFAPQSTNIFPHGTKARASLRHGPLQKPVISGTVKTEAEIGIEGVTIEFSSAKGPWTANVAVRGNYAYLVGGRFIIIDISDPENPSEISSYPEGSDYVALSGDYAYLGNLDIIDISNPYGPQYAGEYKGERGEGIAVSGNNAYVPGSLTILKNPLAPEISIADPVAWEIVHGSVSIEVLASHSLGIDRVEFYIDDVWQSTDSTSAYSYTWNTAFVADGPHRIRARAYNNNGKSSDSEIEVTIRNQWNLNIYHSSGGTTNPDTGTYSHNYGIEISLTAIPDNGYRFTGWTGDVPEGHENDNPLTITMESDKSITANFIKQWTLTLSVGTGGITDPAPGSYTHDEGAEVSLTAIPDSGYRFSGWSGDASGSSNSITITMNADRSITANFVKQWILTITAGTGGITDPAPGSHTHDEGIEVSLIAIPDSGYRFSGWSGDASGTTNPITITMDSDKSITASFSATTTDEDEAEAEEKKMPCFIATAAYGSPLHPHVDVLRDLRDRYLMSSKLGRLLVDLYYRYSPFAADLIAEHKALNFVVRVSLLPLVAFSYSLLHFGPVITAVMLLLIFGLPVFPILFFRKKMRKKS